jgi:regulator of cell morphogenesis and NO signaling
MNINKESIIGDLVAAQYKFASVFKNAGIDFCCHGNRTVGVACAEKSINPDEFIGQLNAIADSNISADKDYNSWPLDFLADYIERVHHKYVTDKITEIAPYLQKIVQVHGDHHPELAEIEQLFTRSAGELSMHMKKEELIVFPRIKRILHASLTGEPLPPARFDSIQTPISAMLHEHDEEGERFAQINSLTQGYTPPPDACNTYRVTYAMLHEFEEDLHLHIHLENNILFPKAIQIEENL